VGIDFIYSLTIQFWALMCNFVSNWKLLVFDLGRRKRRG
jgi:hypothetical protein